MVNFVIHNSEFAILFFPMVFIAGFKDVAPQTKTGAHAGKLHRDDITVLESQFLQELKSDAFCLRLAGADDHRL